MILSTRCFWTAALALTFAALLAGCASKKIQTPTVQPKPAHAAEGSPVSSSLKWTEVSTPFPAAGITAVGNAFWICGADEMIASSSDGGNTWKLRHSQTGGKILLRIAFVNTKVGHAAGKDGLLLATTDGGKTWKTQTTSDDLLAFSFADAKNGIALFGDEPDVPRSMAPIYWNELRVAGEVKLTHDGGAHWENIPFLNSEKMKSFDRTVEVAALNREHYLIIRNEGMIEDVFVVTEDDGKTWKVVHQRNDETNRDFAKRVFVRDGEYWAFGTQLRDRQHGGGGMASMTRHSKDGENWLPGIDVSHDMSPCNSQGCYLWDGAIESVYGSKPQYWNVPQDGSLSSRWAIAGNRICTIGTVFECGSAIAVEKPQPEERNLRSNGRPPKITNLTFSGCVRCEVSVIQLDPGIDWRGRVTATLSLAQDGSVMDLSLDGAPNGPLGPLMRKQIREWQFVSQPTSSTEGRPKKILIDVKCVDAPEVPPMDGCQLSNAESEANRAAK